MVVKNARKNPCLSKKNTETNSIPPFQQNPPTIQQFFHLPFLGIFGKVNPPPLKKRGDWNYVGSSVFSDFLHSDHDIVVADHDI